MKLINTIYEFIVNQVDGSEKKLDEYKGNVILIVNTASKCGFTRQFAQLQALYEKYKQQGFIILGFPCDQFRNQEFSQIEKTIEFCEVNYHVTFPMFNKINVNGANEHPLYTFLKQQKGGIVTDAIKWNFTKFLINKEGKVIKRYSPIQRFNRIERDIVNVINTNVNL